MKLLQIPLLEEWQQDMDKITIGEIVTDRDGFAHHYIVFEK
jgi:hypothetical protein